MKNIKILTVLLWWVLYTLLIPICLVVSFVMRFKFGFPKAEVDNFEFVNVVTQKDIDKLNHDIGMGQDKCKFAGLYYYSTNKLEEWDMFYDSFVDEQSCLFHRGLGYEDKAFSGDMYIGVAIAVATALKNNHISDEQKEILAKCFQNLVYGGWIPFRQPHEDYSRGFQSMPPICNGMAINVLNILKLGTLLNKGLTKYLFYLWHGLFFVSSLPLFIFGCYDRFFWWYKVVGAFSYNTHSDMILYNSCKLLNMSFAQKGIDYIYKVHGHYNIDYQVLSSNSSNSSTIRLNLGRLLQSRSVTFSKSETQRVFSIKDFKFIEVLKEQPIGKQCQTYAWERFGSRGNPNINQSDMDIIIAWNLLNNNEVENNEY